MVELKVTRGTESWVFFPLAYNIILTISIGIIAIIEIHWLWKLIMIVLVSVVLFCLCFHSVYIRNKIVGVFSKSKEMVENH